MPTDLLTKQTKYDREIAQLTFMDDDFSRVAMDRDCLQSILQIIRNEPFLELKNFTHQKVLNNFAGRGAWTDFYGMDTQRRHMILELQNEDSGANLLRARFLGSLVDMMISEPNDRWSSMEEIAVHFITENDVINEGEPIYHIAPYIEELAKKANMKISYIVAHTQSKGKLEELMKDLCEKDPEKIKNPALRKRALYFKKGPGKEDMCKIMEDIEERGKVQGRKEGRKEGIIEGKVLMIKNLMRKNNFSAGDAMDMLDIPVIEQEKYLLYLML